MTTPPDHPESGPREFGVKAKSFFANWMAMHDSLEDAKDGSPKAEWCDIREYVSVDAIAKAEARIVELEKERDDAQAYFAKSNADRVRLAEGAGAMQDKLTAAEARVKELEESGTARQRMRLCQRAQAAERERDEAKRSLRDNACGYCDFDRSLSKERDQLRAEVNKLRKELDDMIVSTGGI